MQSFKGSHIISVDQFDRSSIDSLFALVPIMKRIRYRELDIAPLAGYNLANLFFEASTRTRMSFSSAFHYLGGNVNGTTGVVFSSINKGESLADTIRVISGINDIVVIRHPDAGSADIAAQHSLVPVINGGDGPREHPTQSLLDLYQIYDSTGRLDQLHIALIGDLQYGRTVHSLVKLSALFNDITFTLVSPPTLQLPNELKSFLTTKGISFTETNSLEEGVSDADVLYVTRVQKERFPNNDMYNAVSGSYVLTKEIFNTYAKQNAIILHPLPRVDELSTNLDDLPNAQYFLQSDHGLYVRMALFLQILGRDDAVQKRLIQEGTVQSTVR